MAASSELALTAREPQARARVDPAISSSEVFAAHAGYVLGLLRRLGVREADVEDVAQDVFLVVHERLPGFQHRSSLKTWICGICLRKASNYRRRARHQRERLPGDLPERGVEGGQEAQLAARQHGARLMAVLEELPDRQREVFVLFEIEELPMVDVARALGCPRFTASPRLRAARRALRARFGGHGRAP